MDFTQLIMAIITLALGVFLFCSVLKKHNKVDTESVAVVQSVQYLGRSGAKKMYAIKYLIQSSVPFELIETPCKKERPIGSERVIYYEKKGDGEEGPVTNYYFKTIKQFDKRFIFPSFIILLGALWIVSIIVLAV
jgi:hypothetical protein